MNLLISFCFLYEIPGNHDLAVRGNILYADSFIDLVAIDISDPINPVEVDREEDIFPFQSWHNGFFADQERGVVTGWELDTVTQIVDGNQGYHHYGGFARNEADVLQSNGLSNSPTTSNVGSNLDVPTGIGGSLARFTIVNDYMYAVTDQELISFDISDLRDPRQRDSQEIGWAIETIFPFKDVLLIGSQFGMFIYSIENPATPIYLSEFQHVRSCDPVVAEGDYAYVTLRNGRPCRNGDNQLDVLDISNLTQPRLVASYQMRGPNGLGVKDGTLFICDADGLKVFDTSDPLKITQNTIAHFTDVRAMDVIPLHNLLLVIGENGFSQYDYSNLDDIQLLSEIPIVSD